MARKTIAQKNAEAQALREAQEAEFMQNLLMNVLKLIARAQKVNIDTRVVDDGALTITFFDRDEDDQVSLTMIDEFSNDLEWRFNELGFLVNFAEQRAEEDRKQAELVKSVRSKLSAEELKAIGL